MNTNKASGVKLIPKYQLFNAVQRTVSQTLLKTTQSFNQKLRLPKSVPKKLITHSRTSRLSFDALVSNLMFFIPHQKLTRKFWYLRRVNFSDFTLIF